MLRTFATSLMRRQRDMSRTTIRFFNNCQVRTLCDSANAKWWLAIYGKSYGRMCLGCATFFCLAYINNRI